MNAPSASLPSMLGRNALSGFLVALIALPLCLGIAMASGFPPIAGVTSAIVGGLLASHLGSARLSIKGPAAGLIVIALGAVTELGAGDPVQGYRQALAVGAVAAVLQIGLALIRADRIATVMPPSVVHGMLAAIGVIIIANQVPVMVGVLGARGGTLEMLVEIPHHLWTSNPAILPIGAVSLLILLTSPRLPWIARISGPLWVLLFAVPAGWALGLPSGAEGALLGHAYVVGPQHLVQLPGNLLDAVVLPDFSAITSVTSIKYVAMFALVGSIESLLSVVAIDAMDPAKRASNLNRDLLVLGGANLAASMVGGLPMISEIVRSRANVDAGATSAWSNFFHGAFLLIAVALLPGFVQLIPLAALAAMLVVTGLRLASWKEFRHAWLIGWDQLALFAATLVVTILTDLLIGVAVGIALKLLLHVVRGRDLVGIFRAPVDVVRDGSRLTLVVRGPLAFTNLMGVEARLRDHVDDTVETVVIDVRAARFVDHTSQARLAAIAAGWRHARMELVGLDELQSTGHHPQSSRFKGSR